MSKLKRTSTEFSRMAEKRFAIVFSGRIVDGADEAQVRKNLANLFNVEAKKIDAMFSGKPVLIKKDLDETKARGYQAALAKAGAVVELAATKTPNQATNAPSGAAKSHPDAKPEPTPNPTAAQHDESPAGATSGARFDHCRSWRDDHRT